MIEELCPFDINDEDALKIEDRLERVDRVTLRLQMRVRNLIKQVKARKFRHNPDLLDEKMISSSQYSIFDSQETDFEVEEDGDQEWKEGQKETDTNKEKRRPEKYKKKPLDQDLSQFARRRRVAEKRETLGQWAEEEGVTVTKLLGYFLHLENYMENRNIAAAGWKLFQGEELEGKPKMSLEEVIWMREKSGMSEAVMQEVRLRFLNRYN